MPHSHPNNKNREEAARKKALRQLAIVVASATLSPKEKLDLEKKKHVQLEKTCRHQEKFRYRLACFF